MKVLAKYKYGLDLPREERSTVVVDGRMDRARTLEYSPCVVCGEDRITHDCHVIPRTEGGPNHPDNLLALCPLHHHLFDHHRLSTEEWTTVDRALEDKMASARMYARGVRLPHLRAFWAQSIS